MNFTMEYYLSKYEELSVLSDTKKCRTSLMRNKDTGELVVKKEMGKESFSVYSLLKSIKNKNLIKVLECFRDEDKTIEIEEYVNGKRLDDYFREKKATLEQVVDVGIALCEGLAPMHKLNLVHRDIQPKNIIITNEGSLKIIDFDISRKENENATHDTTLLGTVGYAAPEQYGFAQTTNRSDIYSIGAVLKELSSFSELDKIIAKCMEMDPANRYENVEQLENELEKIKELLNKYGIYFVCEKTLPGTKIRGCFKVKGRQPAVYVTDNYADKDSFFFELFHELGHCKSDYNEGKNKIIIEREDAEIAKGKRIALNLWNGGEHDLDKIAQTTELTLEQVREAITEPRPA